MRLPGSPYALPSRRPVNLEQVERRLRASLDGPWVPHPAPSCSAPDASRLRAGPTGSVSSGVIRGPHLHQLLIDAEEDRVQRAALVGMREGD